MSPSVHFFALCVRCHRKRAYHMFDALRDEQHKNDMFSVQHDRAPSEPSAPAAASEEGQETAAGGGQGEGPVHASPAKSGTEAETQVIHSILDFRSSACRRLQGGP